MISREEYKKTYIRMMDSIRFLCKGSRSCAGVSCDKCPLCSLCKETESKAFQPFEIIEAVEQWGKENPVATNGDKFKEVFGIDFDNGLCYASRDWRSLNCKNYECESCPKGKNADYHSPEGEMK